LLLFSLMQCGEEAMDSDLYVSVPRRYTEDDTMNAMAGPARQKPQVWRLVYTCGHEHPHHSQKR